MLTEERMVHFQIQIQDIRDFKANQWRFSNYGVLIQAALTAVDVNLEKSSTSTEWILTALSVVTFGAILWLIYEATEQWVLRRSNYLALAAQITEPFPDVLRKFREQRKNAKKAKWNWNHVWTVLEASEEFKWLFLFVQLVGMGLALLVIWSGGPQITLSSWVTL